MTETITTFKALDKKVDEHAKILADEITSRNFIKSDDLFEYIKTWFHVAIREANKIQVSDLVLQKEGLKGELLNMDNMPSWKRFELQDQLSKLNLKIKAKNKIESAYENNNEYNLLKKYVETRLGFDFLKGFYNSIKQ